MQAGWRQVNGASVDSWRRHGSGSLCALQLAAFQPSCFVHRLDRVIHRLRFNQSSTGIVVRWVAQSCRHILLRVFNWYVEVGLERGFGFKVNRQVAGMVTLNHMGSVLRIDDIEAVDRVGGANNMSNLHALPSVGYVHPHHYVGVVDPNT